MKIPRDRREQGGILTKVGFSSKPLAMEPPVSPAAPTSRTLVRDMVGEEEFEAGRFKGSE